MSSPYCYITDNHYTSCKCSGRSNNKQSSSHTLTVAKGVLRRPYDRLPLHYKMENSKQKVQHPQELIRAT